MTLVLLDSGPLDELLEELRQINLQLEMIVVALPCPYCRLTGDRHVRTCPRFQPSD